MKTAKISRIFSNKGMTILQFIFVILLVFLLIAIFFEAGFYLRSEATIVAYTNMAVDKVASTGGLTENQAKSLADQLNTEGIRNINIMIYDSATPNQPVISYVRDQSDPELSEEEYKNNLGTDGTMGFRHNFKLVILGEHPLREVNTVGFDTVAATVAYGATGKVERFKPE